MAGFNNTTLVILIKKTGGKITDVCLAYKKRGFGKARWNGVGGKVNSNTETIETAAIREAQEEIGVACHNITKMAELAFTFPHQPNWNQLMHVYLCEAWQGEPQESEEMKPQWFHLVDIPFANMWPDDIYWLPEVLKGNRVMGEFEFTDADIISMQKVEMVASFK